MQKKPKLDNSMKDEIEQEAEALSILPPEGASEPEEAQEEGKTAEEVLKELDEARKRGRLIIQTPMGGICLEKGKLDAFIRFKEEMVKKYGKGLSNPQTIELASQMAFYSMRGQLRRNERMGDAKQGKQATDAGTGLDGAVNQSLMNVQGDEGLAKLLQDTIMRKQLHEILKSVGVDDEGKRDTAIKQMSDNFTMKDMMQFKFMDKMFAEKGGEGGNMMTVMLTLMQQGQERMYQQQQQNMQMMIQAQKEEKAKEVPPEMLAIIKNQEQQMEQLKQMMLSKEQKEEMRLSDEKRREEMKQMMDGFSNALKDRDEKINSLIGMIQDKKEEEILRQKQEIEEKKEVERVAREQNRDDKFNQVLQTLVASQQTQNEQYMKVIQDMLDKKVSNLLGKQPDSGAPKQRMAEYLKEAKEVITDYETTVRELKSSFGLTEETPLDRAKNSAIDKIMEAVAPIASGVGEYLGNMGGQGYAPQPQPYIQPQGQPYVQQPQMQPQGLQPPPNPNQTVLTPTPQPVAVPVINLPPPTYGETRIDEQNKQMYIHPDDRAEIFGVVEKHYPDAIKGIYELRDTNRGKEYAITREDIFRKAVKAMSKEGKYEVVDGPKTEQAIAPPPKPEIVPDNARLEVSGKNGEQPKAEQPKEEAKPEGKDEPTG